MTTYRRVPRAAAVADLRSAPGNDEPPADAPEPPAQQTAQELQGVLDDAFERGILEEPASAAEARAQGVSAARLDTFDGESVLVETVEPKARKPRKPKASK